MAYLISAIKSSIEYHAMPLNPTARHQPMRSAGRRYACAWRWSVTGILLSRKGGVMKPIRKASSLSGAGSEGDGFSFRNREDVAVLGELGDHVFSAG